MKKSLLTLFILPLALPICACNQEVEEVVPVRYEESYNTVTIDDAPLDENGVLNIPAEVGGKTVVSIKSGAFENRKDIRRVVLPETIASIGSKAFAGCTNLKRMNIPESVKVVAFNSFDGDEGVELKVAHSYDHWKEIYKGSLSDDKVECKTYTYNVMGKGERTVEFGAKVRLEAPEKFAHSLSNWIISEIDGEKSDTLPGATTEFTFEYRKNVAIEAVYAANSYNIILHDRNDTSAPKSVSVKHGELPASVKVPSKLGHKFLGYFIEESELDPSQTMVFNELGIATRVFREDESLDVYAHWSINTYVASFDTKGGTAEDPIEVEFGEILVFPEYIPSKTGYSFGGWKYGENTYTSSEVVYQWGEDIVFEAVWSPRTLTVNFDPNGGTVSIESQTLTYGVKYELPVPTREGYDFVKWSNSYGIYQTGVCHYNGEYSSVTLTAQWTLHKWKISYQNVSDDYIIVTYDYSAISEENVVKTYHKADAINLVPAYEYPSSGYVFDWWYLNSGLTQRLTPSTVLGSDVTLYPKWVAQPVGEVEVISDATTCTYENQKYITIASTTSSSAPMGLLFRANEAGTHYVVHRSATTSYDYFYYYSVVNVTTNTVLVPYYSAYGPSTKSTSFSCSANDLIFVRFYRYYAGQSVDAYVYLSGFEAAAEMHPLVGFDVENGAKEGKAAVGDAYKLDKQYKHGYEFQGYYTEDNGGGDKLTDGSGNSISAWSFSEDKTVYPYFTAI